MKKSFGLFLLTCLSVHTLYAQTDTAVSPKPLPEVTVRAYEHNTSLLITPAAVGIINTTELGAYNNTNILQAVNTIPGIRMEERSPGSYRFGIRGSALESPFGVRNVKVYYNDIPYTDPSGNTYLNQLGFYNISSLEVIKGPGSSLYGSGTGGVLLINSIPDEWHQGATVNYTGGSYGLSNSEAEIRMGDSGTRNIIRYQHLSSNGYREQSAMHNDIISWDGVIKHNKSNKLSVHFLYGDLYYQTPGGLTLNEYNADPQQARPTAGTIPGAIQAQAAIHQQTFLSGFTYKQQLSERWNNATTLYGDYSRQLNPNLRNYSRTSQPNFGGRTTFNYEVLREQWSLKWSTGAEAQQEFAQNKTYYVLNGMPQNLQADQEITNGQIMGFTQLYVQTGNWIFTGGASINKLNVALTTLTGGTTTEQDKTYSNQIAPRLAILNRLTQNTSVYATVEKGFSPPTTDELAPTGSQVNFSLAPEQGWNYEAGLRGYAMNHQLYYDINAFYFQLQNAIVQRRDSAGGDYYTNSGSANQAGVEVLLKYKLLQGERLIDPYFRIGYAGSYFRYDKFVQLTSDYSGKTMPGTPENTLSPGATLTSRYGIYLDIDYYYCDRIALNDANTAYTAPYHLLNVKAGYKMNRRKYTVDIFAGINNILNQTYSLGNDINAVNGRYYNAAAPINYFAGVSVGYLK